MIIINGNIIENNNVALSINNRGFTYGDAVFETIKVVHNKILFWEDHYFRLMASMRILRMEIPMNFTLEFIENQINKLININELSKSSVRVKLIINRKEGGLYTPTNNDVEYVILTKQLDEDFYTLNDQNYQIDLYKDFYVAPGLLSTLKSNNRLINVVGGVYAKENNLDNCLVLNTSKNVIEALNGNLFLIKGTTIKTPPLGDGCVKGVMRKQIIEILNALPEYTIKEVSISPFELQKADELFITNVITGIQPVTNYRKKTFTSTFSEMLIGKLNTKIRLS
ncbi:aminotransferase class IV [Flavobacteriaceae bacterium AU392]|nr:aminotransferase class IV [Flavobacteriaceae bacterium]RKM86466.1 aminotransferase class IV [Flavobacteriaceae bacterium AU392]